MITLKRIFINDNLYSWAMRLLKISFPSSERRDDDFQRKTMLYSPDYRLCAIIHDNIPVGVVGYFDNENFLYFENFCIEPKERNKGFGSDTLRLMTACNKPFILEIELPVDEITKKRLNFYKRNGMVENPFFHIQAHYHKNDEDLELMILSFQKPLTQQQYDNFRLYLDKFVDIKAWST